MSLLSEILGLGGGAALATSAYNSLDDLAGSVRQDVAPIAEQTAEMATFRPFGVTSTLGGANVNAQGGVDVGLSPQQQALQDLLGTGAQSMFSQAMQAPGMREGDVYERIRAVQRPEEERQRLALEERLANQGRMGVRTSMFGGTPEQFATSQAQAEAQNQAALMALQQAQSEQAQQASLGSQFMQQQYAPQSAILNLLGQGTQIANIADAARRQAAGLFGQAQMGGLEAQLGAKLGQANLAGQLGTGLLSGVLTPQYGADGTVFGGLSELGGLFGGEEGA